MPSFSNALRRSWSWSALIWLLLSVSACAPRVECPAMSSGGEGARGQTREQAHQLEEPGDELVSALGQLEDLPHEGLGVGRQRLHQLGVVVLRAALPGRPLCGLRGLRSLLLHGGGSRLRSLGRRRRDRRLRARYHRDRRRLAGRRDLLQVDLAHGPGTAGEVGGRGRRASERRGRRRAAHFWAGFFAAPFLLT
jgi:hypothetical protein